MDEKKVALATNNWGIKDDNDLYEDESGRQVGNFVVGYVANEKGDAVRYIQEPIYTDLVTALHDKQKGFKTDINIQQFPPVVILYQGQVLIHNNHVSDYIEDIKRAMEEVSTELIMESATELRLMEMHGRRHKTDKIRAFEYMIRSETGKPYNSALIKYVLKNTIYNLKDEEAEINEILQQMTDEELVVFMGEAIQYSLCESTSSEQFAGLLENHDLSEVEKAINKELAYRYYLGMI